MSRAVFDFDFDFRGVGGVVSGVFGAGALVGDEEGRNVGRERREESRSVVLAGSRARSLGLPVRTTATDESEDDDGDEFFGTGGGGDEFFGEVRGLASVL